MKNKAALYVAATVLLSSIVIYSLPSIVEGATTYLTISGTQYYNNTTFNDYKIDIPITATVYFDNCTFQSSVITANGMIFINGSSMNDTVIYGNTSLKMALNNTVLSKNTYLHINNGTLYNISSNGGGEIIFYLYDNVSIFDTNIIGPKLSCYLYKNNHTISNFTFIYDGSGSESFTAFTTFGYNITFTDLHIFTLPYIITMIHQGIVIQPKSHDINITNFYMNNLYAQGIEADGYNITIRNGSISNITGYDCIQIYHSNYHNTYPHNIYMQNLTLENPNYNTIAIGEAHDIVVEDVKFSGCRDNDGISLFTLDSDTELNRIHDLIFINITGYNNYNDIGFQDTGMDFDNVIIQDSTFKSGKNIRTGSVIHSLDISDSTFYGLINIEYDALNVVIDDCNLYGSIRTLGNAESSNILIMNSVMDGGSISALYGRLTIVNSDILNTTGIFSNNITISHSTIQDSDFKCVGDALCSLNITMCDINRTDIRGNENSTLWLVNNWWYNNAGIYSPDNLYGGTNNAIHSMNGPVHTLPYITKPTDEVIIDIEGGWMLVSLYTNMSVYDIFTEYQDIDSIVYIDLITRQYIPFLRGLNIEVQKSTYLLTTIPLYVYTDTPTTITVNAALPDTLPEHLVEGWNSISVPYSGLHVSDLFDEYITVEVVILYRDGLYVPYHRDLLYTDVVIERDEIIFLYVNPL